jgi:RNA polymerase primary sigma factor
MKLVRSKKKTLGRVVQPSGGESDDGKAVVRTSDPRRERPEPRDREESLFRRYLRDVNGLDVMAPEQEFDLARKIENLKIALWAEVLVFRAGIALVAEVAQDIRVDEELGSPVDWPAYEKLVANTPASPGGARNAKTAGKTTKKAAKPSALDKKIEALSLEASNRDPEGRYLDELLEEMVSLPPPRTRKIRGWDEYAVKLRGSRARLRIAKNEFVTANLRLVVAVAARYSRELLSFEDLVQEGNIGLMKAVDRYDYRKGFRFSTYASWWIRHAIGRALADKARLVRLPVHVLDAQQKVERTRRTLTTQLGRKPTAPELSAATGLALEEVERIIALPPSIPVSLDEPFSDEDDDRSRLEALADPDPGPEPIDKMERVEMEKTMLRLMGHLKPVEVDILRKRFGLYDGRERTLQEIGDEHRLSRERIRQVQDRALSKLRGALDEVLTSGPRGEFMSDPATAR